MTSVTNKEDCELQSDVRATKTRDIHVDAAMFDPCNGTLFNRGHSTFLARSPDLSLVKLVWNISLNGLG